MTLSLIVAVAENGVIGRGGDLPWRMSSDLKTFRRLTMGKPLIMGRKTFDTLKQPLDGRLNVVVTRDARFRRAGVIVCPTIDAAICEAERSEYFQDTQEIMVIGGAEIYRQVLGRADRIYYTVVHAEPEGDTFFAPLDPYEWTEVSSEALAQGRRDDFAATLKVFERRRSNRGSDGAGLSGADKTAG